MVTLSQFGIEGKVAIVTGAGQGIGKAIAVSFANVGAHVVVAEINAAKGKATADEIRASGGKSLSVVTDVSDSRQIAKLVDATMSEFGRIDVLVNNAGILLPLSPAVDIKEADWERVLNNDLKSVFLCSTAVARVMIRQNSGNIINIASMGGIMAKPGSAAYSVAKAGVINFTLTLAAELSIHHIRVNAIAPGLIDSEMGTVRGSAKERVERVGLPLWRIGTPEDIAAAAIYLASDVSGYVNGHTLEVMGAPIVRKGDMDLFMAKFPNA